MITAADCENIATSVDSPWKALVVIAMFCLIGFIVWCLFR